MPTFTQGYVEPGVYVKIQDVVLPALPPGAFVGALTGTGKSDKKISQEKVVKSSTKWTLANKPILRLEKNINGIEYVSGLDGTEYLKTTDFTIDYALGEITQVPGGATLPDTIVVTYYISKVPAIDYDPKVFSSLDQVINEYGLADDDNDGAIENTLTLGAQVYFENGGGLLVCVQVESDDLAGHEAAIDKLKNVDVYCIVPLLACNSTTNTALINYIKSHVTQMSSTIERRERIALLGGPIGSDDKSDIETSVTNYITTITSVAKDRVGYLVPSEGKKTLSTGQVVVDGPILACAVAGIICNPAYTSGEPISGKDLNGLDDITDIYTRYQKNRMAAVGGMILEKSGARMYIRHALSTDVSTVVTSELKITRIKDFIARTMRDSLGAMFINTRNVGTITLESIKSACSLLLGGIIQLRDIVSYQNLTVVQNSVDPRQVDVSFQIRPSWDINWILVTFGVSL